MQVTPTELLVLLREGTAPLKARSAIARGDVRLPSARLLQALRLLVEDPDPGVREDARSLLRRLPAPPAADTMRAAAGMAEETEPAFDPLLTAEETEEDAPAAEPRADGAESARQLSIFALLKKMSVGQKVALAIKGNREVRNILIRDTNKMLCLKVLENPRISDADVEAYAKSTNLSEDVLRGIAGRKEWCKKYPVVKALVLNPKAPLGVTLEFLKRLNLKDLEQLAKNRNVPETLRSAARRLHALKREQVR
jgi:hypothetical protein